MRKHKSPLTNSGERPTRSRSRKSEAEVKTRNASSAVSSQDSDGGQGYPKQNIKRTSLRAGFAVLAGRIAGALSRRLHLGGGTSIAGLVAQRFHPHIVRHLASQLEYGIITVTGTNGKTTTSGFIAGILRAAGLHVLHNKEGSNLMGGVASSLIMRASLNGHLRDSKKGISIFEVDEAVVPQVMRAVPPRIAVFTNLFRDQLDRYGEVDSVSARWRAAVEALPETTTLVLNADDPTIANLGRLFAGRVLYFGVDDSAFDLTNQDGSADRYQVMDTRTCSQCGSDYTYSLRFYSHMGHYSCPNCGLQRPSPNIRAVRISSDSFDRLRIQLVTPTHQGEVIVPLPGLYNTYNALAAVAVAHCLDTDWEPIVTSIERFQPVFGRGEQVQVKGRTLRLLLAKNPTGFNEVLRTLFSDGTPRHVFFILNDKTADGKDVSWIWDVDFERVQGQTLSLVVAGTRALDLALRLKYAGVNEQDMTIVRPAPLRGMQREEIARGRPQRTSRPSRVKGTASGQTALETLESVPATEAVNQYGIASALDRAILQTPEGETLFVVPTYTGLLELHHELEQRGLTPRYWES